MERPPPLMSERLRQEYHWTDRQREVLDMLAKSRTNAEIADTLGITLAGAKWHVAEILSKLQCESREEAAEYWRRYTGAGPRFARIFRGAAGLTLPKAVITALGAIAVVGAVAGFMLFRGGTEERSAEDLIAASAEQMAMESFALVAAECDGCPPLPVLEYTPGRSMVANPESPGEAWPFVLLEDTTVYVSMEGRRWRQNDDNDYQALGLLVFEPATLLPSLTNLSRSPAQDDPTCTTIVGKLDGDALAAAISPVLKDPGLVDVADGGDVTICIDETTSRLRSARIDLPSDQDSPGRFMVDYDRALSIPAIIESMDGSRVNQLQEPAERGAALLVEAIRHHYQQNGAYPQDLSPITLGDDFLWPVNVLTGAPMRNSPGAPYDFDYSTNADGTEFTFKLKAWDGPILMMSERNGSPVRPRQ